MARLDAVEKQLAQWKIEQDENHGEVRHRVLPAFTKLPKNLQTAGLAVLGLNAKGEDEDTDYEEDDKKREAAQKKQRELHTKFDKLSAADRKKIFAVLAPDIPESLEAAWQLLKSLPYQVGYTRKAFRAPNHGEVTLPGRVQWLRSFAEETAEYRTEALTLPWLARWAHHAFRYRTECIVPILIAAMNSGKSGDEVFDILYRSVTREDPIGIMSSHVIQSLLGSDRQAGWEIIEKTLLAAQRQEGLRQSILESADLAHPEAFRRLLRLILDKDLIRFSSVARSVNVWLGLLWDSVSAKILTENVESILTFLESPAEQKKAAAGDNPELAYRALWASAFENAPATIPAAAKLLKNSSDEMRFVGTWILTLMGLELAEKTKLAAMDDSSLQVALMAAVKTDGISLAEAVDVELDAPEISDKDRFERLERLYERLPEKPQKLAAIVWPWTERRIERSMITGHLLSAIGDRAPTKMLPYLKGLSSWEQQRVIDMLAAQKKWDALTRSSLIELVGHPSSDVRGAAVNALEKQTLKADEIETMEGYLTRQATDLRKGVIGLISKADDETVIASADRLLAKGDRHQRFAGLEILRQMAEANRLRKACQSKAAEYRAARKKVTKEEETQLTAIADSEREIVSLDNALGLMNPEGRSKVVAPKRKKVLTISKAAIACIKSLDDLVHQHRTTLVNVKTWRGSEEIPLGEVSSYQLPMLNLSKPLKPQRAKFPLIEEWEQWNSGRAANLRDKDGLELLRASFAAEMFDDYDFDDLKDYVKKQDQKKIAIAILGEFESPKIRYLSVVQRILNWLFYADIPKGTTDFLLDCAENTYASVTEPLMKALVTKEPRAKKRSYWDDDDNDWRNETVFEKWPGLLRRYRQVTNVRPSAEQARRIWELQRFHDEPCPGAPRQRLHLSDIAIAYRNKLAAFDDIVDCLLGPGREEYRGFSELHSYTARPLHKEIQNVVDETKGLQELLDKIRSIILEIELLRGEAPTAATRPALSLRSIFGIDNLFRVMSALNKGKLKVERGWRSDAGESRNATLTHLMKISFPADTETAAEFSRSAKQAITDGYCSEERLLELTFLAPQWSKFVGETLGWDGFSEGLYWFLSHMSTWRTDATEAAAGAEGLTDETDIDDIDDDDLDDDEDESSSDSIPAPEKLSAWERLVLERTPLTQEERQEGAVDVAWFHRTWETLGEKRWRQMAEAAKFAANSAQANKAQFLADVLLGKKSRKDLIDGIQKKNLKEHVRLLGLLPLEAGAKRDKDLMLRYEVLQGYKKYARGLSSLTKPAAMRAVEIGMNNLARLSGYPDPLRLEWALEAESTRDLAKGPVSVTKDGVTVTLQLDEEAKPQLSIQRGDKSLKAIPAPIKKKHAAIAELADRATELRKKTSRIKLSLENAMCRGDAIAAAELIQLFEHAILAPQLARIILIGDGIRGYPDKGGKVLRDYNGKLNPIKKNEQLKIAHPCDLFAGGDWDKWQHECFRAERVQPFKQVFRELYVITKQEKKDQTASQRFAGQQIGPKQAMALWNSRGWNTQDGVCKIFHDLSLIAEVSFQYDYGTAAEVEGLTVEKVEFRKRDDYKPLKLSAIPPAVFSEIMRDVDLVVSVAHRGEVDPEASASTVEMRSALIRETCDLLGLKNVRLKNSHAIIKGYYGEYSLHMGSGGIHRLPGGALAILPVHSQHRGRLFLPFADDDPRTAEVISKVLLLARDEEIQDPTILDQLGAPVGKRKVILSDAPAAGKSGAVKSPVSKGSKAVSVKAGEASATPASGSRRHFEFTDGKSNKFWEVELSGNSVTTKWGRIGTDGQSKTKDFPDTAKAKAEYEKLVKEKVSKGYQET